MHRQDQFPREASTKLWNKIILLLLLLLLLFIVHTQPPPPPTPLTSSIMMTFERLLVNKNKIKPTLLLAILLYVYLHNSYYSIIINISYHHVIIIALQTVTLNLKRKRDILGTYFNNVHTIQIQRCLSGWTSYVLSSLWHTMRTKTTSRLSIT